MPQRTRKRQSNHVALTLPPIVKAYLERIEWALTYGSDIVVFSDDPGAADHNYVRHVKDHPRPKTLQIGPVSVEEVDTLVAFIRSCIDFSGTPTLTREQFATPEFSYPTQTIVCRSLGDDADANC
jgi:hypothetical protein